MAVKNGVKQIQIANYNGACTVVNIIETRGQILPATLQFFCIFNKKNDKNCHDPPSCTSNLTNPKSHHPPINFSQIRNNTAPTEIWTRASSLRSSLPSPLDRWYLASHRQKSIFKFILMEQSLFCFLLAKIEWTFIVYQNYIATLCNDQL